MAKVSLNPDDYPRNDADKKYVFKKSGPAERALASRSSEPAQNDDAQPKHVERVVTSAPRRRKPTVGSKARELFLGEDATTVKEYVVQDILIPALKETISDMVSQGLELALFGTTKGKRNKKSNATYTSYSSYYEKDERPQRSRRTQNTRPNSRRRIDEVILGTRGEADEVLYTMYDLLRDYGAVTVEDLYELIGERSEYTDQKWGWTDLTGSRVRRIRDGYLLEIPEPRPLD